MELAKSYTLDPICHIEFICIRDPYSIIKELLNDRLNHRLYMYWRSFSGARNFCNKFKHQPGFPAVKWVFISKILFKMMKEALI